MRERPKMEVITDRFNGEEAVWIEDIKCFVHEVVYSWRYQTGVLRMLTGNCCSMSGAIRLFERIDPNVRMIVSCHADGHTSTIYGKLHGQWSATRGPPNENHWAKPFYDA